MSSPASPSPTAADSLPLAGNASGIVPLWAIFAFTFANSVGTGVVTNGVFFLTKHGFGFTQNQNYILGVILGVTYIAASLTAGPLLHKLSERRQSLTPRRVLGAVMSLMGLCCVIPWAAHALSTDRGPHAGAWSVWVLVLLYSPLTGLLWPIVEAYLSGGRSGRRLRSSVGRWNVVWSAAVALSYWFSAPMIENNPRVVLIGLGAMHILTCLVLITFTPRPMPHGTPGPGVDERHADPVRYAALLRTFRVLLPMSYLVSSALGPYLPDSMERLGLHSTWAMVAASAWLVARVFTFATLERWHAWHGSWLAPLGGVVLLLSGFAVAVITPQVLSGQSAVLLSVAGLFCFGVGMATIYCGSLYYALALGNAEVEAGGTHEALIGVGYTIGPMCGYATALAVGAGILAPRQFDAAMLGVVAMISLGVCGLAASRGLAGARGLEPTPRKAPKTEW